MSTATIDTNLLVRLITYDVPDLAHKAAAMIEPVGDETIELPLYVLAEIVYVLAYNPSYTYSRFQINQSLLKIIDIPQFHLNRGVARQALNTFNLTKLDFVDCLLLAETCSSGGKLFTFDKELLRELDKHS